MENLTFEIQFEQYNPPQWVVYSLHDQTGVIQFIGYTQFKTLLHVPDAKKHPMFERVFGTVRKATMKIHKLYDTKTDCRVYVNKYLIEHDRPFMMKYLHNMTSKTPIRCTQTDEVFDSLTEAASAHGVSKGSLSKHINGDPDHQTVEGKTYERIYIENEHIRRKL